MMSAAVIHLRRYLAFLGLAVALGWPALALAAGTSTTAAPPPAAPPPPAPPPGFERVAGAPDTEKVDANQLVVAAYAVFFGGMFGYLIYIARKQAEMAKEMAELASRIDRVKKS
jgi:CcmD family protein